jgi:hypothetical protein
LNITLSLIKKLNIFLPLPHLVRVVTYLPYHRFHEVIKYQVANAKLLGVDSVVAYVDNVFEKEQLDLLLLIADRFNDRIEVRAGAWGNRNDTWFTMLCDYESDVDDVWLVIDSDNVVIDPATIIKASKTLKPVFGVLDKTAMTNGGRDIPPQFRPRTLDFIVKDGVFHYLYRVYEPTIFRNPFFFGPKQIVGLTQKLDYCSVVRRLREAMSEVDPWLRNYISDETVLGMIMHELGVREVPYIAGATEHRVHPSIKTRRMPKELIAKAHYQLAKALIKHGFNPKDYTPYLIRYVLSHAINTMRYFF